MKKISITRRPRRLRLSNVIRELVSETKLDAKKFIQPVFITAGKTSEISSLPGIYRYNYNELDSHLKELIEYGINTILLFPHIEHKYKDNTGSYFLKKSFYLYETIKKIKKNYPSLIVGCDVALDPYTDHGQDGLIDKQGKILNDETILELVKLSLNLAKAGVDIIAPSDMMDGRIGFIRKELDINSFEDKIILAYSAKYASAFYGPFRDALSSHVKGDKKSYQMNITNQKEALLEAKLDIDEGADIIMVKPALAYLDIVQLYKQSFYVPIAVYNVSGEYAMLQAASANGWLDYETAVIEIFTSFVRSGADIIISYSALDVAKILSSN